MQTPGRKPRTGLERECLNINTLSKRTGLGMDPVRYSIVMKTRCFCTTRHGGSPDIGQQASSDIELYKMINSGSNPLNRIN